ncbi:MAG: RluA family pseudouridine synthase [Lentisphaerae bacterium]|nr:MAG: RluA family pseudouridine synthase [Lentisphaerota bacterium]
MSRLFALRQVRKGYLAAVYPALPRDHMRVEAPIGRHPVNRKKMSTSTRAGRPAVSHFFELCRGQSASLVLARILTGRTHQIRVHLHDECNAGVIGDQIYRRRSPHTSVSRQLLHAWYLAFPHPETGKEIEITAPVPEDFSRFMRETQLTLDQDKALRLARKTLT